MRHALLATCIVVLGLSVPSATAAENPTVIMPPDSVPQSADAMGFLRVRAIRTPAWEIEKIKNPDGLWTAKLSARGATVTTFAECGDREDWMRFMVWPVDAPTPDLLLVLRYSGGANGYDSLDVLSLQENYRTVFRSTWTFIFSDIKDLNGDNSPEIIAKSRHYEGVLGLGVTHSPKPTLVFSYLRDAKQYRCQNDLFRTYLQEQTDVYRRRFEGSPEARTKFSYQKWNNAHQPVVSDLLHWILNVCYQGQEDAAWEYLKAFTTPETEQSIRTAIEERLKSDPFYQELAKLRNGGTVKI